jgi:crotonobetainyl-CoA:carnitine CoA-transferase CaiB-like acyl-CoA transferase
VRLQPPTLGQHTAELLLGLGYSEADITQLQASAAVA